MFFFFFAWKHTEMGFLTAHFAWLLKFGAILNLNYNGGISIRFYFEEFVTSRAHTCKMCGESKQSVIVWNPWSSSLNRMGARTCWHRLTRPVFPPQHSLFHITHACSCFCVSKNCTWELGICWFCTQMLLKSHSDIIMPLHKRYWKLTLAKALEECFRGSDGSNVFVKVCCLTYLHSYTNFNAGM